MLFSNVLTRLSLAALSGAVLALGSSATATPTGDPCRMWFAVEEKVWIYNCSGDCPGTGSCSMIASWDMDEGVGYTMCMCGHSPARGSACNGVRVQDAWGWWIDCIATACDSGCTNPVFGAMPSPSCGCNYK